MFDLNLSLPHAELQGFMRFHSEALQNASLLLGGKPALRATGSLIEDLCSSPTLTRRMAAGLVRLYELLSLEHVHDPMRPEWAYFADLDPVAPYVEDICLLCEALKDILIQLDQAEEAPFLFAA